MDQKPEVKIEPEDKKIGTTWSQPRFRLAVGLAVALLLVTCTVAAGGLMMHFRGKCGNKRYTIKTSVNGQTFTEEVEVDRENGMVVYRDDVSTEDGEIIQTKEGLSVLYQRGNCYLMEDEKNNQTSEFDIDEAEAAMESLSVDSDVPSFDVDRIVFLNRSVPVSPEDDVILRPQLPPVCRDAPLYRVQEEDARDYLGQENDDGEMMETSQSRVRRSWALPQAPEHVHDIDDMDVNDGVEDEPQCMILSRVLYVGRCYRYWSFYWWRRRPRCTCQFQCTRWCRCYKLEFICPG